MEENLKPKKRKSGKYKNLPVVLVTLLFLVVILALSYILKRSITDLMILIPLIFVGVLFILSLFSTLRAVKIYNKELLLFYNPESGDMAQGTFVRAYSKGRSYIKDNGRKFYVKFYAIEYKYTDTDGNEITKVSNMYYDQKELLYLQSLSQLNVAVKGNTSAIIEDINKAYELNIEEINNNIKSNMQDIPLNICPTPPVFHTHTPTSPKASKMILMFAPIFMLGGAVGVYFITKQLIISIFIGIGAIACFVGIIKAKPKKIQPTDDNFRETKGILKDIQLSDRSPHSFAIIASLNNPDRTMPVKVKDVAWAKYLRNLIGKEIPIKVNTHKIYINYDEIYRTYTNGETYEQIHENGN